LDNLTHTLTGLALARTGLARWGPGSTAALVLASNIPDLDLLFGLKGAVSYLEHHRDLSHSILGAPLLALGLAVALRVVVRGSAFWRLLGLTLAGVGGHVFMDLWTSYGTRVLAPFDRTFFAWDLVFVVDPLILVALLLATLLSMRLRDERFASVGLGLLAAYVGGRAVAHSVALEEARLRVPAAAVVRAVALPNALDPLRWRAIVDTGPAYWTGEVRLLGGPTPPLRRRGKLDETPLVQRVRATSDVAGVFLAFSTFPWLEVERTAEGTTVSWRDLRYERPGRDSFVARVVLGRDGSIVREGFRF
jgi:inner membrane protein